MQPSTRWVLALGCLSLTATARAATTARTPAELVSQMRAAAAALEDYQVAGEGVSDGKHQHFRFFFKKPDLVRLDAGDGQVAVQPNGNVRGRLGHGPFGRISRKLNRDDDRLKDPEGIPFWDSYFAAVVARIEDQIQKGATAAMESGPETHTLTIRSGHTTWTYVIDDRTLFFRENSRTVDGREVERTRYSDFRPNTGLSESFFKF